MFNSLKRLVSLIFLFYLRPLAKEVTNKSLRVSVLLIVEDDFDHDCVDVTALSPLVTYIISVKW